jgi:hypothetical protein
VDNAIRLEGCADSLNERIGAATPPGRSRLLNSRQPSSTEVSMRLIGLAPILALSLVVALLTAEGRHAGTVSRIDQGIE